MKNAFIGRRSARLHRSQIMLVVALLSILVLPMTAAGGAQHESYRLEKLWSTDNLELVPFPEQVSDIAFIDGKTYVADRRLVSVLIFDDEGNHLGNLGGQADRPGRYADPVAVFALSDGSIAVADAGVHLNIHVYQSDGSYLRSHEIRRFPEAFTMSYGSVSAVDNGVAVRGTMWTYPDETTGEFGKGREVIWHARLDTDSIHMVAETPIEDVRGKAEVDETYVTGQFRWAARGDRIVVNSEYDRCAIVSYSISSGETSETLCDMKPVERSALEIDQVRRRFGRVGPDMKALVKPRPISGAIGAIYARPNGELWLSSGHRPRDASARAIEFEALDEDLHTRGRVTIEFPSVVDPFASRLFLRDEHVYAVHRGSERVVGQPYTRPSLTCLRLVPVSNGQRSAEATGD